MIATSFHITLWNKNNVKNWPHLTDNKEINMYPFSFQNPTRIEFGLDKEKEMGKYMHEYGAKKALIIYGSERIKHSGLFGRCG